ncbi:hypothetical protein [Tateyamaria sp.]|uniref:hypothetical protein n=1 Tax=Tateyamaria sp. TaxID=1929288 RepID=UPI003B20CA92
MIRLLHKDPFNELKGAHIEHADKGRAQLAAFRKKLSASSLVRFWESPETLGGEVLHSLTRPCCTNQLRDSFYESSVVAGGYEQLVPYEVQDQELAFVQHGAKAARFAINLV